MTKNLLPLLLLPLAAADVLWQDVCTQSDVAKSEWCDTTKPRDVRAAAFVAALTAEEKIPLMVCNTPLLAS